MGNGVYVFFHRKMTLGPLSAEGCKARSQVRVTTRLSAAACLRWLLFGQALGPGLSGCEG